MKISTKGIYALEIVADLAMYSGKGRLESLNNVAVRRNLSEKYLERIIKSLREAGLVESVRGAHGGYRLKKAPDTLTVKEVLSAVEGELAPVECLTRETDCGIDCSSCPTRATWGSMWEIICSVAEEIKISDILEKVENRD